MILTIKDDSRAMNAIAMGDETEKLIGINVRRLYEADWGVHLFCLVLYNCDVYRSVIDCFVCQ